MLKTNTLLFLPKNVLKKLGCDVPYTLSLRAEDEAFAEILTLKL